ncbi:hypothetical protein [Azorhizobium caulinodans]|uniref:hypothetical protein n=1 Tax=Azorhizobium caulinodans TaxID=7 RepID=UPI002FBE81D5
MSRHHGQPRRIEMQVLPQPAAPPGGAEANGGPAATDGEARLNRGALVGMGLVAVLLTGAAGFLWMRHGVAIFFDTVVAGLATCF